ncbi:MAG TPA: flagellin [Verrucomicrobiae bacterium]|nr:flagellin [Verrucomicrobiae bacterium]
MNVLTGADVVLLNLDRNQQAFEKTVEQLSSGLRINSAADDPSGNAIATNLTSKVGGLQQAVNNVQNGINALNVANGALVSVQNILVRINNLLVEANSDINSAKDLQDIQTEINSLMNEINTIGEKTNFNGLNLLDGAFDTSEGSNPAITRVASPFGGTDQVVNASGNTDSPGNAGPLIQFASIPNVGGFNVPAFVVFTVVAEGQNLVDPDSGVVQFPGAGVLIQTDVYSTNDSGSLAQPLFTDVSAYPAGAGPNPFGTLALFAGGGTNILNYAFNNVTEQDVGSSEAFLITGATAAAGGTALTINDGGEEGQTLGFSLPTVNTNALGISDITCLLPQQTTIVAGSGGTATQVGTDASNNITASYSQLLVQNALTTITTNEAQIGAQIVAMNDDNSDDNTAIVNYQQSISDIADLNVGQATTQYTQEQILTSVGTEVLSQIQSNGKIMTALLIQALIA